GHLAWRQQPQLRVDRLVPLHRLPRHRGHSGIRLNQIPAGRRRVSPRPRRVREWGTAAGWRERGFEGRRRHRGMGAAEMVGEVEVFVCYLYGRMVVTWWWARLERFIAVFG